MEAARASGGLAMRLQGKTTTVWRPDRRRHVPSPPLRPKPPKNTGQQLERGSGCGVRPQSGRSGTRRRPRL